MFKKKVLLICFLTRCFFSTILYYKLIVLSFRTCFQKVKNSFVMNSVLKVVMGMETCSSMAPLFLDKKVGFSYTGLCSVHRETK